MNRFIFDSHEKKIPIIMVALIAGIVGAFLVIIALRFTSLGEKVTLKQAEKRESARLSSQPNLISSEQNIIDVVQAVGPSVVMITSTNIVVENYDFFFGPEVANVQSLGSGVVFRSDGYILTNYHVIKNSSGMVAKIVVVLSKQTDNSGKAYPAKIIGVDPQTDLAILKIEAQNLPSLKWANSNEVQVGQTAIAIGNPLAENLQNSVTVGVISAMGRTLTTGNSQLRNMLQTDASINPGNSGGPLIDSKGLLIGINTAIAAHSQGIGFAIPSNTAKYVADQLIKKGHVTRPGLGMVYIHFSKKNYRDLENRLGFKLPVQEGLFIIKVLPKSPAATVGMRPGDIITEINNNVVQAQDIYKGIIANSKVGSKLKLTCYRGNRLKKITVKIGEL